VVSEEGEGGAREKAREDCRRELQVSARWAIGARNRKSKVASSKIFLQRRKLEIEGGGKKSNKGGGEEKIRYAGGPINSRNRPYCRRQTDGEMYWDDRKKGKGPTWKRKVHGERTGSCAPARIRTSSRTAPGR